MTTESVILYSLREICVNELCAVLHCDADWATDAPVTH